VGLRNERTIDSCTKDSEVKGSLVKANLRRERQGMRSWRGTAKEEERGASGVGPPLVFGIYTCLYLYLYL